MAARRSGCGIVVALGLGLWASALGAQPVQLPNTAPASLYEDRDPWLTDPTIQVLQSGGVAVHDTVFGADQTVLETLEAVGVTIRDNARAVARLTLHFENPDTGAEGVIWCSGFLVAPDLLLTARHCVSRGGGARLKRAHAVFEYYRPERNGGASQRIEIVQVVEQDQRLDYALLRLAEENEYIVPIMIGRDHVRSQTQRLYVIHHPKTLPTRVTRFGCRVQAEDDLAPGAFAHSCDTYDSSSGSPIFAVDTDEVIGLHVAGTGVLSEFNQGMDLSEIIQASPMLTTVVRETYPLFFIRDDAPVGTVYFEWDRSSLPAEGRQVVAAIADRLSGIEGRRIYVTGHADGTNSSVYGVGMAMRRAQAVADFLVANGIPQTSLIVESRGTTDAVRSGSFGRDPLWRRVEIRLAPEA